EHPVVGAHAVGGDEVVGGEGRDPVGQRQRDVLPRHRAGSGPDLDAALEGGAPEQPAVLVVALEDAVRLASMTPALHDQPSSLVADLGGTVRTPVPGLDHPADLAVRMPDDVLAALRAAGQRCEGDERDADRPWHRPILCTLPGMAHPETPARSTS